MRCSSGPDVTDRGALSPFARWWVSLALVLLGACSSEVVPTQVIVAIDADPEVSQKLTSLDIVIYDPREVAARGADAVEHQRREFFVNTGRASPGTVTFPFSVGVKKSSSQDFLVVITGKVGKHEVIKHKALVSFVDGELRGLGIYLASPCLDQLCVSEDDWLTSCRAQTGSCEAVEEQATTPVKRGAELDAGLVMTEGVGPSAPRGTGPGAMDGDATGTDATVSPVAPGTPTNPTTPADSSAPTLDAGRGDAGGSAPDINECATVNLCTSADYPCVQTASPGYTCQGQFADWHMPDALAGSKFAPSYDTSTPGIVVDKVTGLVWQRDLPATYAGCTGRVTSGQGQVGDACSWVDAKNYCKELPLAGGGWHLPTKIELESIIDETKSDPAIDGAFSDTPAQAFWTASPSVGSSGTAWFVYFSNGGSYFLDTSKTFRVRCVR